MTFIFTGAGKHRSHRSLCHLSETHHIMLRSAIIRASRTLVASSPRLSQSLVRRTVRPSFTNFNTPNTITRVTAVRCYASGSGLSQEEVTGRILDLLKNFDKVGFTLGARSDGAGAEN